MGKEFTVGFGRGRKAAGHAHATGQLADHLPQGSVLATDLLDVGHAQFGEGDDIAGHDGILARRLESELARILVRFAAVHYCRVPY